MTEPLRHLVWTRGGHAEIVRVDDDAIELRSTTSAPPGARLEASLGEDPSQGVKIKSHGSRREADGSFLLRGRLLDATRDLRDRLARLYPRPAL